MEIVAAMPRARVEGFLAAGHAATITGCGVFESVRGARTGSRSSSPASSRSTSSRALVRLLDAMLEGRASVVNAFPRCVTRDGNRRALETLWFVFDSADGHWRGIADVPGGNLRLRPEFARFDARARFAD